MKKFTEGMQSFSSKKQDVNLGKSIFDRFLPELFESFKKESIDKTIDPNVRCLRPTYDIALITEFPKGSSRIFYYPGQNCIDSVYTSKIELVAAAVDSKSPTGLGSKVLATLKNDGYNWNIQINPLRNLLVNPDALYQLVQKYSKN